MHHDVPGGGEAAPTLNNETLHEQSPDVAVPGYDRDALRAGIAHISVGAFHRAHQQRYFDELAELGETDWGVIGIGLHSRGISEALEPQDLLYTVVERGADGDEARVIGTLTAYLYAGDDPQAVIAALADPAIRIVSLTVTGNGYHVDLNERTLRADDEDVVHDLGRPPRPTTFLAYVVEALARRREAGVAPFTVLSCDNVPENGDLTRAAVVGFARLLDEALADWIQAHVTFPNGMVDRITPSISEDATQLVAEAFGVVDREPVIAEPYRQWILEDRFCNGRPPLERVGVQFVDDVGPYELMKTRLLNGSHTALAPVGSLLGHQTIDEAMADPLCRAYVETLMRDEVAPLLPPVPGIDLDEYQETLLERFANVATGDELARLGRRSSTKMPSYVLPSLCEARAAERPYALLTVAVAFWLRRLRGVDFDGNELPIEDPRAEELQDLAAKAANDPRPLLSDRSIFGDLADDEGFAERVEELLTQMEADGPRATLEAAIDQAAQQEAQPA